MPSYFRAYYSTSVPRAVTRVRDIAAEQRTQRADRKAIVDEFGRLSAKIANTRSFERRHEQLREIISGWYADPAQKYNEEGNDFSLEVGPRAKRRTVTDLANLSERLGTKFLGLCSISIEKLDRILPQDEQTGYVTEQLSGPRSIKAVRKFKETAA